MMNWICSIPDHIGWMMVGVVGMLALIMLGLVGYTVVNMIIERMKDDESEVC
jgi:hypothetical protein